MTVIWINGTFGAGKTTTAGVLVGLSEGTRLFDPEHVGYMLRANLSDQEFTDFQQLPPWRMLVPVVMDEIARLTGDHLIAVQTVLVESYWRELEEGSALAVTTSSTSSWTPTPKPSTPASTPTPRATTSARGATTTWPPTNPPAPGSSQQPTWS